MVRGYFDVVNVVVVFCNEEKGYFFFGVVIVLKIIFGLFEFLRFIKSWMVDRFFFVMVLKEIVCIDVIFMFSIGKVDYILLFVYFGVNGLDRGRVE